MAISFIHKIHPRSRSLRLRIEPNGQVVVSSPRFVLKSQVEHFVNQHTEWINRTLSKLNRRREQTSGNQSVSIFGKDYQKKVISDARSPVGIKINGQFLEITPVARADSPATITVNSAALTTQINRFLKATAEKYLIPRTHQLAKIMAIEFQNITLREQKSRWGSCSTHGNLNFNWRLVHYAPPIIDYVIIHELAHRRQMNHSAAFWAIVAKFDPNYNQHRRWLKNHGLSVG